MPTGPARSASESSGATSSARRSSDRDRSDGTTSGRADADPRTSDATRLIGERIRAERLRVGVTQMDLADLAGLNVANFGRIERGIGNPSIDTLIRVAGVLGVDVADFVRGITVDQLGPAHPRFTAADFLRAQAERGR